ncbi:polymer-forming cytoskeletal protein [Halorubrum sp. AD140]|uniref:polymer-forming cytoskeletal protein n=1 Tax=Halorubrum sp. AD140 TaxID=3050073 RepID=UPI002ACC4A46|nr:polymer-forming cytoskeletal protein [Halorubrum sp. AD140]MDZ5812668.1 polymer-forming cytoskeletal protein [Halorubrum sp. AD140]
MSLRGDGPIEELAVPSGTTVEEHDLVTDGDVLVGGQSTVEFGLRGRNVAIGERVRVGNDIEAEGDCRLDTWCSVDGNVLVGEDAYLSERVTVTGRLMVSGDLDIGDDVSIEEGFEANGWIVIRNPVPTIVFYFIVLSQLLRVGETDAADELAEALADGEDVRDPLLVPRGAEISDDAWRVSTPATVGDDCRLHGNLRAESVRVGERNEVFGSLRAREGITVGADTVIHGDVTTRGGTVTVEAGARVLGDVSAGDLVVHDGAEIDGSLRARGEMKLVQETGDAAPDNDGSASVDDEAATEGDDGGGAGDDADAENAESDAESVESAAEGDDESAAEGDDESAAEGDDESADADANAESEAIGADSASEGEAIKEPPVADAEAVAGEGPSSDASQTHAAADEDDTEAAADEDDTEVTPDEDDTDADSGTTEPAADPDAEAT